MFNLETKKGVLTVSKIDTTALRKEFERTQVLKVLVKVNDIVSTSPSHCMTLTQDELGCVDVSIALEAMGTLTVKTIMDEHGVLDHLYRGQYYDYGKDVETLHIYHPRKSIKPMFTYEEDTGTLRAISNRALNPALINEHVTQILEANAGGYSSIDIAKVNVTKKGMETDQSITLQLNVSMINTEVKWFLGNKSYDVYEQASETVASYLNELSAALRSAILKSK